MADTSTARRGSGILLHMTSLPSNMGVGDMGPCAFRFADKLSTGHQSYWQVLPLGPTSTENGNSPYRTDSAFAGNTLLISHEILAEEGLLPKGFDTTIRTSSPKVDYERATAAKKRLMKRAYENFMKNHEAGDSLFDSFCTNNSKWLDDYALHKALKDRIYSPWYLWPPLLRDRNKKALAEKAERLQNAIDQERFVQFEFYKQWQALKGYCNKRGVSIIGDMPLYVSNDSADVWIHPELFRLNARKKPLYVSGVPPDYFSATGQLWRTPVYDWREMKATGFEWWMDRMQHSLRLFDFLRIDHFRGLIAYWRIPSREKAAVKGRWVRTPSKSFFDTLKRRFPELPFIAEDLGVITPNVRLTMRRLGIPGMRVLLFAFDGSKNNPHLPRNHPANSVVSTGTHDTNTARGWFVEEATPKQKKHLFKYVGKEVNEKQISWELIKLAMESKACTSIIPMQDPLCLEASARMNRPAQPEGNWTWRVTPRQFESAELERLAEITEAYQRAR